MKIKELEELLSISRSNIRFYEKQGLFSPQRKENNYRDYGPEDIAALKEIIVYRKLGFTIEEIAQIQNKELPFREGVTTAQERLEKEIEQLTGSLQLLREVSNAHSSFEEMDHCQYWETIQRRESAGEAFSDIFMDYLLFERDILDSMWKRIFFHDHQEIRKKHGVWKASLLLFVICLLRGLSRVLIWKESFWSGFLDPWILFGIITLIMLPIFILRRKKPKAAEIAQSVLFWASALFLASIFLYFIVSVIKAILS